jgi:nucleoside-diphosphate-sugar epimerase
VVDTSGYVPRNVLDVAGAMAPMAARYVFMSTVSVYRDWPIKPLSEGSEVLSCPPNAGPDYGTDAEDGPTAYGYQKAGCEAAVVAAFGAGRTTILRPGVVLGPREYIGRLPWWLRRVASGGRVVAPGSPERTIQPIDVRDLAAFVLTVVKNEVAGAFNVCAPVGSTTFGELLNACAATTGSKTRSCFPPRSNSSAGSCSRAIIAACRHLMMICCAAFHSSGGCHLSCGRASAPSRTSKRTRKAI